MLTPLSAPTRKPFVSPTPNHGTPKGAPQGVANKPPVVAGLMLTFLTDEGPERGLLKVVANVAYCIKPQYISLTRSAGLLTVPGLPEARNAYLGGSTSTRREVACETD